MINKGYVATPAGQVHFRRVEGAGPPVILLHRTPMSSASFDAMLRRMDDRRAAVALDTPGFGQSFSPVGSPSARNYAQWFAAAIDELGLGRFHLCAHHTGTHFAAELAVMAPERVLSLTLSGVMHAEADERRRTRRAIGSPPGMDLERGHFAETWRLVKPFFPGAPIDLVAAEALGALGARAGIVQAFDAIFDQDFAALLTRVRCPIQIVQAVDDPLTGQLSRVRAVHPDIPVSFLGSAGIAAPELQSRPFAASLLRFVEPIDDASSKSPVMPERRFEMHKAAVGFDLKSIAVERPSPGPGEVLVRVRAVSLNRRDVMILKGQGYPTGEADGFTPLSDAAGDVVAVGAGVTTVAAGDKVCSTFFQTWPDGRISFDALGSVLGAGGRGVLADHIVLAATGVTPMPKGWSFEEAATLPCAAVTAWSSLVTHGRVQAGDWVLVMGTGGVALFGLQIAVAAGAKVVVISSSDEKLERAKALGATIGINYAKHPDWEAGVKEATDGGVQHVLELGGAGTLQRSMASLALGGHLGLVGGLDGFGGDMSAVGLIIGVQTVTAISVGSRADQLALIAFLEDHRIKPVIDDVFDLETIEAAYDRADAGAFGKVVVRLD